MKKLLSILFALALVFSLAACSGESAAPDTNSVVGQQAEAPSPSSEVVASPAASETAAEPEAGGILIAYFSWSGNTEQLAQIIQEETGGDLFEITPAAPYTENYDELLDIAQQEQAEGARPELANQVENWETYDVVFIGYPNWWSDAPMAVYTFLESYDFEGKTLIPFNTSSSGGFGRSLSGLEESAPGATILEGLAVTEGQLADAQGEVSEWLTGLNLT